MRGRKLSAAHQARKRDLKNTVARPLSDLSPEDIDQMFVGFAEVCRLEGVLALGDIAEKADDRLLREGLQIMLDGTEPETIAEILETLMASLIRQQKVKYLKILEGIMSVQAGDHPRLVGKKLGLIF